MLPLTSLYTRVSRVSSTTRASHTDPEEQVDPIREHKPVGRCGGRTTTYVLEACRLDVAIQGSPLKYRRSRHACEKL